MQQRQGESITLRNVPSFADRLRCRSRSRAWAPFSSTPLLAATASSWPTQTRWALRCRPTRHAISPSWAARSPRAANAQLGFSHPTLPGWKHFSFCFITGPLETVDGTLSSRNACVIKPGKIDRSPTGTGCSALMAVLHAKGLMKTGDSFIGRSIIESRFVGEIWGSKRWSATTALHPDDLRLRLDHRPVHADA